MSVLRSVLLLLVCCSLLTVSHADDFSDIDDLLSEPTTPADTSTENWQDELDALGSGNSTTPPDNALTAVKKQCQPHWQIERSKACPLYQFKPRPTFTLSSTRSCTTIIDNGRRTESDGCKSPAERKCAARGISGSSGMRRCVEKLEALWERQKQEAKQRKAEAEQRKARRQRQQCLAEYDHCHRYRERINAGQLPPPLYSNWDEDDQSTIDELDAVFDTEIEAVLRQSAAEQRAEEQQRQTEQAAAQRREREQQEARQRQQQQVEAEQQANKRRYCLAQKVPDCDCAEFYPDIKFRTCGQ